MNPTLFVRVAAVSALGIGLATAAAAHGADAVSTLGIHNMPPLLASALGSSAPRVVSIPTSISTGQPCGGTAPLDGSTWTCTFDDEFNATSLDRSVWTPQVNFPTGDQNYHACYVDDPRTISESNGSLHLSMVTIPSTNTIPCGQMSAVPTSYITAQVSTYHAFSQEYGRFEARIRNTAATVGGLQEDYWFWPDERTGSTPIDTSVPGNGEMDVVEAFSNAPHDAQPYLHYTATDNTGPQPGLNTATCPAERGVWNTYDLIWNSQYVAIYVNGTLCLQNTSQDPAFNKAYITLFSMAMGSIGNEFNSQTPMPATLDVDYARAWQYSN